MLLNLGKYFLSQGAACKLETHKCHQFIEGWVEPAFLLRRNEEGSSLTTEKGYAGVHGTSMDKSHLG